MTCNENSLESNKFGRNMLSYLCESHFWTTDEEIVIKHTDLGAFKYETKKPPSKSAYVEGKKAWVEGRGGSWRGHSRIKETLKQMMTGAAGRCVHCSWLPGMPLPTLRLLLASGCMLHIRIHPQASQPLSLHIDKYLMGKLSNNNIQQVLFLADHILVIYSDSQALLVSLNKAPSTKSSVPTKLASRDPKLQIVELCAGGNVWGSGRSVGEISGSCGGVYVLLWRRASPCDLFPWTPHNDQDNVHIYSINGNQMRVVCNHRVEFDPLWVAFSRIQENVLFSVEQKTSKKGGVVVEWVRLLLQEGSVVCEGGSNGRVRVAAPAPATCASLSRCEKRLLLACSDRSILVHNTTHNLTTTVQAAFVARKCIWWSGGVMVGGGGGQLQAWDSSLAPLRLSPPSDQAPPTPHLDLSTYLKKEPYLEDMVWAEDGILQSGFLHTDGFLLLLLQGGPLVCLRVYIPPYSYEQPPVVRKGQERGALARLRAMDWCTQGSQCLALLHQLINTLFSVPLNRDREQLAEAALGTFLAPPVPLPPSTRQAHLPHLHDLCRKFFHLLIRHGKLEKALCLAIDVGHQDMFMDVHYTAKACGNITLSQEAMQHARDAESSCGSCCSDPSCSGCSSGSEMDETQLTRERSHNGNTEIGRNVEKGGNVGGLLDLYGAGHTNSSHQPPRAAPPLPSLHPQPPLPDITQHHYVLPDKAGCTEWSSYYSVYPSSRVHLPQQQFPPRKHQQSSNPTLSPPLAACSKSNLPEKNKVKFSDTVTVAVVPQEVPRKERRIIRSGPPDWRKELADSLPLCHPNHDYLKDFTPNPVSGVDGQEQKQEKATKIKVVHFGLV